MLKQNNLYDPVVRPEHTKEINFDRYVEIHKRQTSPTGAGFVSRIKRQFYESNSEYSQEALDKIWGFVGPKVEQNSGLAEFIEDFNAAESKYFFPWLINVFRSPATALEISYGAGPDLGGEWSEDILGSNDPLVPFIQDDPAFVYNRERQLFVAELVNAMIASCYGIYSYAPKIIDFGAGRLAWARRHGLVLRDWKLSQSYADIYAFDKDESIDPEALFGVDDMASYGIKYQHADFVSQLQNPELEDADLIILGGVACYIPTEVFMGKIVPAIHQLLRPGGVFFFDLQTSTPCYRHSMDILGWQEINLPDNPSAVIDGAEKIRKALDEKGIKFTASYAIDDNNTIPSAVMIAMQKV